MDVTTNLHAPFVRLGGVKSRVERDAGVLDRVRRDPRPRVSLNTTLTRSKAPRLSEHDRGTPQRDPKPGVSLDTTLTRSKTPRLFEKRP